MRIQGAYFRSGGGGENKKTQERYHLLDSLNKAL